MMLINRITLLVNMANKINMCCQNEQSEIGQCIQCQQSHNYLTLLIIIALKSVS